jgi:hypothetical protein
MSVVTVSREGEQKVIDLAPVEDYIARLEAKTLDISASLEEPHIMTRDQLLFLVSMLRGQVERYRRLWEYSFTPQHAESVARMRELKQLVEGAGETLGDSWEILGT